MKITVLVILGLVIFSVDLRAQLCTGSLGDPVVHITFGAGSGPGPALPGSNTTYRYVTNSCPLDGEYTIGSSSVDCFASSWHTLNEDHTPNDVIGRFMLINASFTPGDFYVDTVRGLCPATNYEFATYVKNVLKPSACSGNGIRPNLTFSVETLTGTVLTTINSGNIAAEDVATWKQYGAFFQTPTGVPDVVIRLTNNAPGGCGNDLAIDDITFRPCGPQIRATANINNNSEVAVCEIDQTNIPLTATFSPGVYSNPSFQWQQSNNAGINWTNIPGATSNTYTHTASPIGIYYYRMLIADGPNINSLACRLATNMITITVSQPNAQVASNFVGCFGTEISLSATGGFEYRWTGPNGFSSNLQQPKISNANFNSQGWYKVRVIDSRGCSDEDSTTLIVHPAPTALVTPEVSICVGSNTTLNASGGTRYYWSPNLALSLDTIPNPVASPIESTTYQIVVTNQFVCSDTAFVKVIVWKKPEANAGPDKKTREGIPVQIKGEIKGTGIRHYWTPTIHVSNPNDLVTNFNPPQSSTYTLHAESIHGCGKATDDVFIEVYPKIIIPNAFSPNGDGINDTWIVEPLDFFEESVTTVYNRYGQLVFQSKGYSRPWDGTRNGKPVPVGTYYYVIDLKTNNEPPIAGSILIIR